MTEKQPITLVEFLKARIEEDRVVALAAANSIEGTDCWFDTANEHIGDHYRRHEPDRVIRQIKADSFLIVRYERKLHSLARHKAAREEYRADCARADETGVWDADYDRSAWAHSLSREEDYLLPMTAHFEALIKYRAAVYSDHPDYRTEWKP